MDPLDENNPFYKADGGPMKPLAKLVIRKLREYKKSCRDQDETFLNFNEITSLSGIFNAYYIRNYCIKVFAQGKNTC